MILIAYQDFKFRAVSWYLFPLSATALVLLQFTEYNKGLIIEYTLINLLLISLQILILSLYFSLREKRFVFPVNAKIGLGDVFMLVVLCMGFSPVNFILFILFVLIAGLFITGILAITSRNINPRIPLAAYLSIAFFLVILSDVFNLFDPYGNYILSIINNQ